MLNWLPLKSDGQSRTALAKRMSDIEDRHKHILINFVICLHNHTTHFLHYSQQLCWKKQLWRQLHTTQTAHLEGGAQRDCEQRLTWSLTVVRDEITQFLLECVEPVCTYWSLHTVGDWSIKLSNWVNHKIEMNFTDSFKLESVKRIKIFGYCFGFFGVFFCFRVQFSETECQSICLKNKLEHSYPG